MERDRVAGALAGIVMLCGACGGADGGGAMDGMESAVGTLADGGDEDEGDDGDEDEDDDGADDGDADGDGGTGGEGGDDDGPTTITAGSDDGVDDGVDDGGSSDGGGDGPPAGVGLCAMEPPAGAPTAPPPPAYSGGVCPVFAPGFNPLTSTGNARQFILVTPTDLHPEERVPLLFLWHWLGGSANSFLETGDVQSAADQFRFIAAIPENKGDLPLRWPFTVLDSEARVEEEVAFFDDMLACISQQYAINNDCVTSAGVSAGGLWTSQLGWRRGNRLASFMALSGGTGSGAREWGGTSHVLPAFVLWGGPGDTCGLNFQDTSHNLENALGGAGHFVVECVHNCGHSAPPFDVPVGTTTFAPLWQFAVDHPYWLAPGESPWAAGLPVGSPEWCSPAIGTATMRQGPCNGSAC